MKEMLFAGSILLVGVLLVILSLVIFRSERTSTMVTSSKHGDKKGYPSRDVIFRPLHQPLRVCIVYGSELHTFTRIANWLHGHESVEYVDFYAEDFSWEEIDALVLVNGARPTAIPEWFPSQRVLALTFEPNVFTDLGPHVMRFAKKYIGAYLIGDASLLPYPFVTHYSFLSYSRNDGPVKPKTKLMSIVVSGKAMTSGHHYRNQLCNAIAQSKLPVDIWGRGSLEYPNGEHTKGPFNGLEPYEDYQFTISVENCSLPGYVSEKYTTPLSHGVTCLYWGCTDMESIFGPSWGHRLTGDLQQDMDFIRSVLAHPSQYVKDLTVARDRLHFEDGNLGWFLSSWIKENP